MIRIRPGRSWRHNPGYLGELRALDSPPRAQDFTGGGILDVLGIEVDGVDIAAKVGEGEILLAVDELTQALLSLGDGEPAAQATVGPGPAELVLEARGQDVLLTLVSLAPPAAILAGGLLLDVARLRSAALAAARGLLLDLLAISPALGDSPVAVRLSSASARLAQRPQRAQRLWPSSGPKRKFEAESLLVRGPAEGGARCELHLCAEGTARLAARAEVPGAPLAALLGQGTLTLRIPGAPAPSAGPTPGLRIEGPLFLTLRNLVRDAAALVAAWEQGDRSFDLPFGAFELRCDLTRDEVRAPGWKRGMVCAPTQLALALAGAARVFADKALKLGPREKGARGKAMPADELLIDLRAAAAELIAHCRDLATGDLRRAPLAVSAPAAPPSPPTQSAPRSQASPLVRGKVRRLVYREAWRESLAAPARPLCILRDCGVLVLASESAVLGVELGTGHALWQKPCAPGSIVRAASGGDLYLAEPGDGLLRLDPGTGEIHWRRRMRGAPQPAPLWAMPGGVLRGLPGEGIALVLDDGTLSFRTRLPGGAPAHVRLVDGVLVAGLATGSICGLDPTDGRILWKRKPGARVLALVEANGQAIALVAAASGALSVVSLAPGSGEARWERPLPGTLGATAAPALLALGDRVLVLAQGESCASVHALALQDGAPRFTAPLPWAGETWLLGAEDQDLDHELWPERRGDVVAASASGAVVRLSERGTEIWQLAGEGSAGQPSLCNNVLLLPRASGTILYDARGGLPIAQLPGCTAHVLAADLSAALVSASLAAEPGALSLHRLTAHLSVV